MENKKRDIIEAAITVVTRYGIKKTSMTDISYEAGVSRQTLYSYFKNKDALWMATIQMITEDYVAQIELGISQASSLLDKLEVILQQIAIVPYDILANAPELHDIVNGYDESSRQALQAADGQFCQLIADLLAQQEKILIGKGVSAGQVADMVFFSCKSLKQTAKDRDHLISMVEALKLSILSLVAN